MKASLVERMARGYFHEAAEHGRSVDRETDVGRRCDSIIVAMQAEVAAGMPNCRTDEERVWAKIIGFGAGTGWEDMIRGWLYDFGGYPFR